MGSWEVPKNEGSSEHKPTLNIYRKYTKKYIKKQLFDTHKIYKETIIYTS